MQLNVHPQISRIRRQSAVEQTSDLLKAYLEHLTGPFGTGDAADETYERAASLSAGFILPREKTA